MADDLFVLLGGIVAGELGIVQVSPKILDLRKIYNSNLHSFEKTPDQ
jgi:hypothetical protein